MANTPQVRHRLPQGFALYVTETLGELKAVMGNVVERLDKINGSVARHEQSIGELRQGQSEEAGAVKQDGKWRAVIIPIVVAIVSVALGAWLRGRF